MNSVVNESKANRKTILKEIESIHKEIEDLRKYIDALEAWMTWSNTFVKRLMDIVGIPPYHETDWTRGNPAGK